MQLKTLSSLVLAFLLGAILLAKCGNENTVPKLISINYDSIIKTHKANAITAINKAKLSERIVDTIKVFKTKYIEKKKTDTLFIEICDSINIVNDKIIYEQDKVIDLYKDVVNYKDSTIIVTEKKVAFNLIEIEQQKELHKLDKKKHRKQVIKAVTIGLVSGAFITSILYNL